LHTLSAVPTFGGGHDLHIANNPNSNSGSYTNFPSSYQDVKGYGQSTFAGAYNFQVDEIEIYAIR
jgi:hypothetical protein